MSRPTLVYEAVQKLQVPRATLPAIPPHLSVYPTDHTGCWQLVEAFVKGDVSHLTPAEDRFMRAQLSIDPEDRYAPFAGRALFKYKLRRAKGMPRSLKELMFGRWEQGWEKEEIGSALGLTHENYYLVLLESLEDMQKNDEVRLRSVKHLDEVPVMESYRGPKLVDLKQAEDVYDIKYRSVLKKN